MDRLEDDDQAWWLAACKRTTVGGMELHHHHHIQRGCFCQRVRGGGGKLAGTLITCAPQTGYDTYTLEAAQKHSLFDEARQTQAAAYADKRLLLPALYYERGARGLR